MKNQIYNLYSRLIILALYKIKFLLNKFKISNIIQIMVLIIKIIIVIRKYI